MPQDELFGTSAKSIGIRMELLTMVGPAKDNVILTVTPLWSKKPCHRDGLICIEVPKYAIWEVPGLLSAAMNQFLGGDPKHIPVIVRGNLNTVLDQYEDGQLPIW